MKRVVINVDLDDNEIFQQAVKEAMDGYIKQLTRERFHEVVEEELERMIKNACEELNHPNFWQRQEIQSQIRSRVNEFMVDAGIYKKELFERASAIMSKAKTDAEQKLSDVISATEKVIGGIDDRIDREIRKRVDIAMKDKLTKAIMERLAENQSQV